MAWTIRWRIVASFGIVLVAMVIMGSVTYAGLAHIRDETARASTDSLPGLSHSMTTSNALVATFVSMEQFALQSDQAGRQRLLLQLQTKRAELDEEIEQYEKTIFSDADRQQFERFKQTRREYGRVKDEILAAAPSQQSRDVVAAVATRLVPEFERTKAAIDAVFAHNRSSAAASFEAITSSVNRAFVGLIATFAAAVIFACLCGITLLRAITRPLGTLTHVVEVMRKGDFTQRALVHRRDELGALAEGFNRMTEELTTLVGHVQKSGLQVTTSVTEIAATAREQQATATEIAATTTEIGATSKEISATSKELVKTMSAVSEVAEQSAALAGAGQTGLTQMEQTIRHVMDAAGSVTAKLATLNERAADISQVVTTITKVADQTNLLSLNAAIEAEKAGEYGRGFAVVATEVRRLADQTAAATYDIDQMVKGIQSAVSAGVMSMDKFSEEVRRGLQAVQDVGNQLTQVIQQVQALAPRFEAVSEGMQAQAAGAEQITEALTQLSDAARQTVESLHQSNLAINELNDVASGLRTGVSKFSLQQAASAA
jgi:methyl-accepting chemotaxis protein WspA